MAGDVVNNFNYLWKVESSLEKKKAEDLEEAHKDLDWLKKFNP